MKHQRSRRLGALVLALAMALSLAVIPAWADDGDLTITGNPQTLEPGKTAGLTATLQEGLANSEVTYKWTCSPEGRVTFDPDDAGTTTVTAGETEGAVTITATASWTVTVAGEDGSETEETKTATADCSLTIASDTVESTDPDSTESPDPDSTESPDPGATDSPAPSTPALSFTYSGEYVLGSTSKWEIDVLATNFTPGVDGDITWSVVPRNGTPAASCPRLTAKAGTGGATATIASVAPGEFTVTATYNGISASQDVVISGIVLSLSELEMQINQDRTIAVSSSYGEAKGYSVTWSSSDNTVVSVMNGSGSMVQVRALALGTSIITAATENGYTAVCETAVVEDRESIAYGEATTGNPLILGTIFSQLNDISKAKTRVYDADGEVTSESELSYITNVTVATSQGTMYYNYSSESNTGAGVSLTERYGKQASGDTIRSLDALYFVPKQGYSGTAEISFTGMAQNGMSFSGTVKVVVDNSGSVSYRTNAGTPVYFLGSDFNAYCRSQTGRDLNYVTFSLPQTSQGTLYYNYTGAGQSGDQVSTATQYGRSGRYLIDDVCFVPSAAFEGTVEIGYRGVDTSGQSFTGKVIINVGPLSTTGDHAVVRLTSYRGQPVVFQPELFNAACQSTLGDTLSYIRLQLPDFDVGTLYYNYRGANDYDARVDTTTRYAYSGVPSLGNITFVPASNASGQVAIPYTGYGMGGTTYTGTVIVDLGGEVDLDTIRYFASKGGTVQFQASDFNNICLRQTGYNMDYVQFTSVPTSSESGNPSNLLYYDYRSNVTPNTRVSTGTSYYYSYSASNPGRYLLGSISFLAGSNATTFTVTYTGRSTNNTTFSGKVEIQVGAPTPTDIALSGNTSSQVRLSSTSLRAVCYAVLNEDLAYIQITSVPTEDQGHLYMGYNGFKTGVEVKSGDRFYRMGTPSIDQLSFIPKGGFAGTATVTYIGFSNSGEAVSGRIVITITKSTASRYFNDMANHVWAVDAVDFLYQNGTSNGVGGGRYSPTGNITKGDFTLMLVRAFGFTSSGSISYKDVPANSYYAEAISTAGMLGIAGGSNGYFYPKAALTRQDAMVMIRNALVADGRTLTNGLAADLSGYYDQKQIANYARAAVGSLVQMGIVQGDGNGYLRPQSRLSRAETAMLMHSIMTL